ncbi:MAG: hypothetical protein ACREA0_15345, partial [bacterium]
FYSTLMMAVAIGAAYFAFAFVRHPAGGMTAGVLAIINPYVLQNIPNPIILWCLALMGATGGLILRAARGAPVPPIAVALVGSLAVYLTLNPPFLAIAAAWVVLLVVLSGPLAGSSMRPRLAGRLVIRALPWAFLLSLWWLVPVALSLAAAGGSYEIVAETDVNVWAWTHARNSVSNVLTLTSTWSWLYPEYFPYSSSLERPLWSLLRFALPALALAAPLLAGGWRRRASLVLILVSLGLILLGKGLHEPFAGFNEALYRYVPGMWLLREPASKLGVALVLLYCALAAITVEAVIHAVRQRGGMRRLGVGVVSGSMVVLAAAYPYPLWTGEVIADRRPRLPSAHVRVPEDWRRLASVVNRSSIRGKVLTLPLNDYYQVPTSWGYYGSDRIPSLLLRRPSIQFSPGGYFSLAPSYQAIVQGVQSSILNRDGSATRRLLAALGVSHVILRKDIALDPSRHPGRYIEQPGRLKPGLRSTPGLELVESTPVGDLYEIEGTPIVSAQTGLLASPEEET